MSFIRTNPIRCLAVALCLLMLPPAGHGEPEVLSGYFRARPILRAVRDSTPNNPGGILFDTSSRYIETFGLLHLDIDYRKSNFFFQVRPRCETENERTECNLYIDEGYLDTEVAPSTFVFGGRRNLVDGVSHVANPTDFLGEDQELDLTLDETERRELRKGVYLAGLQHFFDDGSAVSVAVAPRVGDLQDQKHRLQLKLALLYPEIDTDMEVIGLLTTDRPGIGVNVSHTLNDSTVLYTESALRRGRDRPVIVSNGDEDRIVEGDRNSNYFHGVVGGQYTFDSGVNLILEHLYNENGYSSSEWGEIQGFFRANTAALSTPDSVQAAADLARGNQAMIDRDLLRRQYLFSRLNHPQWWGDTDSSLILVKSMNDGSYLLRGRMEKDITDRVRVGIMAEYMEGDSWDEFGLRPWDQAFIFDLKFFF
uniref:Alginate export domain-containing protein n=1 Tax=Candidatus Kentrum sp. LFY TaxID=2126342 RepID=A0A450UI38_9GAMM|nr:MAG: hypothetical protein BECKLFY1418B_GA0070995_10327 [Candidatus Kentron sp. LFY]VFJ93135.1 MAG: hypothetical protein BECKLFY1418A_GA0070994_10299 [Candidatus Kentron sp. LFY]